MDSPSITQLRCSRCKETKPVSEFYRNAASRTGRCNYCIDCMKQQQKENSARNIDYSDTDKLIKCYTCKQYKQAKEFYRNRVRVNGYTGACILCTKEAKQRNKATSEAYYQNNREYILAKQKEYQQNNPEKERQRRKNYRATHIEDIKEKEKIRQKDPKRKLDSLLRSRVSKVATGKQKSGSSVRDLGCTQEQFRSHIENLFSEGMNWNNFGRGHGRWQLDHIMPLAAFDLANRQHFLLACNYLNIQPLWFSDNMKKSDKIPKVGNTIGTTG